MEKIFFAGVSNSISRRKKGRSFSLLSGTTQLKGQNNQYDKEIVYMLTYDHGGMILWGSDHFQERLRNAVLTLF